MWHRDLRRPADHAARYSDVDLEGVAGVPRASLVVLAATLPQFKIPQSGLLLLLGIDHLLDMGRSAPTLLATVSPLLWYRVGKENGTCDKNGIRFNRRNPNCCKRVATCRATHSPLAVCVRSVADRARMSVPEAGESAGDWGVQGSRCIHDGLGAHSRAALARHCIRLLGEFRASLRISWHVPRGANAGRDAQRRLRLSRSRPHARWVRRSSYLTAQRLVVSLGWRHLGESTG